MSAVEIFLHVLQSAVDRCGGAGWWGNQKQLVRFERCSADYAVAVSDV